MLKSKVLSMDARGMSQRDIAETIEEIYGFSMDAQQISNITNCVLEAVEEWLNSP